MTQPTFYDITRPLGTATPVWPGDPKLKLQWLLRLAAGDVVNMSALSTSVHAGTHADAPYHARGDGTRIGRVPVETFIGRAILVDATERREVDRELVRSILAIEPPPDRVLFRTGAWVRPDEFPTSFAAITSDAAALLAEAGVLLVGTDAPSVDPMHAEDLPAHRIFADAGIVNLENLLLDGVPPGEYELIALPLRLEEADGSPIRAVLKVL